MGRRKTEEGSGGGIWERGILGGEIQGKEKIVAVGGEGENLGKRKAGMTKK